MIVSELTERELVSRVHRRLPPSPPWLTVGIGDDAAVADTMRNRLEVLTVDAVIDGVHFDRRFCPPEAIGHRALAVNLSDLAAMGAEPRLALLSFALPPDLPVADFDGMVSGISELAAAHRLTVAGGNLTRTPGPLAIDITALGTVKRRGVLRRSGAHPGDIVYLSGSVGGAAAGLAMLQQSAAGADQSCVARYLRPEPRVRTGLLLSRNRAPSACIDLSDGLADGLSRIAEASGVGMAIDADVVPIEPGARTWFERHQQDPLLAALDSDDYELLFTVRPRLRGRLRAAMQHGGVSLTRIGVCTPDSGIALRTSDGRELTALPHGFSHFR